MTTHNQAADAHQWAASACLAAAHFAWATAKACDPKTHTHSDMFYAREACQQAVNRAHEASEAAHIATDAATPLANSQAYMLCSASANALEAVSDALGEVDNGVTLATRELWMGVRASLREAAQMHTHTADAHEVTAQAEAVTA